MVLVFVGVGHFLQYDAAVNPETAKTKMKTDSSPVAGKVTPWHELLFPNDGCSYFQMMAATKTGYLLGCGIFGVLSICLGFCFHTRQMFGVLSILRGFGFQPHEV